MTDLLPTIVPKSDQLNADDLIGRNMTVTVTGVALSGAADQPIVIHYEGEDGRPYKPCKSMRRVMVHVWGGDGARYAGRRMTLYRDPKVLFAGQEVGGIRISHMSDLERDVVIALTASKASRKPFTVRPLPRETARLPSPRTGVVNDPADYPAALEATISSADDSGALANVMNAQFATPEWKRFKAADPVRAKAIRESALAKVEALKEDVIP